MLLLLTQRLLHKFDHRKNRLIDFYNFDNHDKRGCALCCVMTAASMSTHLEMETKKPSEDIAPIVVVFEVAIVLNI